MGTLVSNENNKEVLLNIKEDLEKGMYNYTFDLHKDARNLRVPNDRERKEYLIDSIRDIHMENPCTFTTSQYRTMKALIKRGRLNEVFNFLEKKGFKKLRDGFLKFAESRVFEDIEVEIQFPNPVQHCIIEIEVNPNDRPQN